MQFNVVLQSLERCIKCDKTARLVVTGGTLAQTELTLEHKEQ